MLERKIQEQLRAWRARVDREDLVVSGARQEWWSHYQCGLDADRLGTLAARFEPEARLVSV